MLFGDLDVRLLAPCEVPRIEAAAAAGAVAARYDATEEGTFIIHSCSGFAVSPRHVVTAAHCARERLVFDQTHLAAPGDTRAFAIKSFGPILRLLFEGTSLSRPEGAAALPRLGEPVYRNDTLDFAVFALEAPTSSAFIHLPSAGEGSQEREGPEGEELRLYAYPNGMPLSESSRCHRASSPVEEVFLHDCDTMTGSSGGLVVSAARGVALAMHLSSAAGNTAAFFARTGRFESPTDFQAEICSPESETRAAEKACFQVPGYNRALPLSILSRDLERRAAPVWRAIRDASTRPPER